MSFTKLVSLLESRCLFFSRADKLGDPFEGSWPRINISARFEIPDNIPNEGQARFLGAMKNLSGILGQMPRHIALSCWHMNEYESAAMWKLYIESNEGVAVQSTFRRLRESLIDDEQIHLGVVNYIDYQTEGIDARNLMTPFMYKRKSYEHEREVRALIMKIPVNERGADLSAEGITNGLSIRVDMSILVERIFVAPYCPAWFEELVRSVIAKYSYAFDVVHSILDQQPLF
jgi:hypothetical protein